MDISKEKYKNKSIFSCMYCFIYKMQSWNREVSFTLLFLNVHFLKNVHFFLSHIHILSRDSYEHIMPLKFRMYTLGTHFGAFIQLKHYWVHWSNYWLNYPSVLKLIISSKYSFSNIYPWRIITSNVQLLW